ncbi:MAG: hypothetical protein KF729_25715 [Sandaracinaceae bacterium]|nr:hypothetical protein [Sandaracinaceae bacterium]
MAIWRGWGPLALALAAATACGSESGPRVVTAEERAALERHVAAARMAVASVDALASSTDSMLAALEDGSSDAVVDERLAAHEAAVAGLEAAVAALVDAESPLDYAHYGDAPVVHREALLGPVLFVLGAAALAVTMRALNRRMNEQRALRDAAAEREDGEAYRAAHRAMSEIGIEAAEALVEKVVPNPLDRIASTTRVGNVLVSARDTYSDLDVLVGSSACAGDAMAQECRIGASRTDTGAPVVVPADTLQVIVTGSEVSRVVVDDVLVGEGERVTLELGAREAAHCSFTSAMPNPFQYGSVTYCYTAYGPLRTWVYDMCSGALREGSCPAAAGACLDRAQRARGGIALEAWTELDAAGFERARTDCVNAGKEWIAPWLGEG